MKRVNLSLVIGLYLITHGVVGVAQYTITNSVPPPIPMTEVETNLVSRINEYHGLTNGVVCFDIEIVSAPSLVTPAENRRHEGFIFTVQCTDTNRFYWMKISREYRK